MRVLSFLLHLTLAVMTVSTPALADGAGTAPRFLDVRVGEQPGLSRVAIICARPCVAEIDQDNSVFVDGVSGALEVDLSGRDQYISGLSIHNLYSGIFVLADAVAPPASITLTECGANMVCIDYQHPLPEVQLRDVQSRGDIAAEKAPPVVVAAAGSGSAGAADTPVPTAATDQVAPDQTAAGVARIARPQQEQGPVSVTPARTATLRDATPMPAAASAIAPPPDGWQARIATRLAPVSPLELSPDACPGYLATIQSDAYDLDAFRMVALCRAAEGDLDKATDLLLRYSDIYPDDREVREALAILQDLRREQQPARPVMLRDDY